MSHPSISVIIPSYNSSATIAACLGSVLRQSGPHRPELIVVDSSTDGTAELVRTQFPTVRLFSLPERTYPGAARNIGAAHAQGTLLAFIDADCTIEPGFMDELLRRWESEGYPVLAGAILNGNPESYIGWGYYFCSFSAWAARAEPGPRTLPALDEAATGCLVIARSTFAEHGPFSNERFDEDTLLSWKLKRAGLPPRFTPSLRVYHANIDRLGALLVRRFLNGRAFARTRTREQRLSTRDRLLRSLGSPLVPGLLLYRSARSILQRRTYLREFVLALPLTTLGHVAWTCGELSAYCSSFFAAETRAA